MVRVIAEAGTCAGSVEWAHDAIDAAAETGAWGFKVQILDADTLAAPSSPRYDRLPGPDSQHAAFQNQIPRSAWAEIASHCKEVGLEWFASVWDMEGIQICEDIGVDWYKIGSADITYLPLLSEIAKTGKRAILSTGAATWEEIDQAIETLKGEWNAVASLVVMACTLSYPCDNEDAYIGKIHWLRSDPVWDNKIAAYGYSDHTTSLATAGLAVAAGATYLEKHFTITPGKGGDHDFALTPYRMADYVDAAKKADRLMWNSSVDNGVLPSERAARQLARRSLHATRLLEIGTPIIVGVNARWLRPTGGIEPNELFKGPLVATREVEAGNPIRWEDVLKASDGETQR